MDLYLLGLTVSCGRKTDDGSLSKTFVLCSSDPRSWSPSLPACLAVFNQVFKSPRMRSRAKKQAWQHAVGGVDGNGCAGDRLSMVDVNTQSAAEREEDPNLVSGSSPEEPVLLVAWGWLRDGSPGLREAGCSCQQCPRCSSISRHCRSTLLPVGDSLRSSDQMVGPCWKIERTQGPANNNAEKGRLAQ